MPYLEGYLTLTLLKLSKSTLIGQLHYILGMSQSDLKDQDLGLESAV